MERWNPFRGEGLTKKQAALLIYTLIPLIARLAKKLPDRIYALVTVVPFALFAIDIINGYLIRGL